MELLAPAGNVENFHAALDAGADAVYIGAPGINARNLSRDLRLEEIAAMIEFARSSGKKVYLAANSLILDRDLAGLAESLSVLSQLRPDALIVQDLAIIRIVREYFPDLAIHASTLMGAHNSAATELFDKMGCSRVVLARELTLKEIAAIQFRCDVELEVFVHGAMCYSFSGLCLFSSYLGGKSGLRGRCVQPCRRGYTWEQRGKGVRGRKGSSGGSYLFSMNDLSGFSAIPDLKEYGISSIKIEGRMRSANYVAKIVEAYRGVLDAGEGDFEEAVVKAEKLAEEAMARNTSTGYFFTPQPKDAIVPHHSGNMGIHLGSFLSITQKGNILVGKIKMKREVHSGDRLRIHIEKTGERKAFTLHGLRRHGQEADSAGAGDTVQLKLPDGQEQILRSKVDLYKVDTAGIHFRDRLADTVEGMKERIVRIRKNQQQNIQLLKNNIASAAYSQISENSKPDGDFPKKKSGKKIELWLKTDSPQVVFGRLPFTPDGLILNMNKSLLSQTAKIKKHYGKNIRKLIWSLPPILFERDYSRVRKQAGLLVRSGFKNFQLGHIGQRSLFGSERVNLFGDYTLNIANSQAMLSLEEEGFEGAQAALELDKEGYSSLASAYNRNCELNRKSSRLRLGITVFGVPALFTSRLDATHFQHKKNLLSPKNEEFSLVKHNGMVLTLPVRPFSLLPYLSEIAKNGYDYAVIDICFMKGGERELTEIYDRIFHKGKHRKLSTFNYLGKLE